MEDSELTKEIKSLFIQAKEKDEFEFICSLIYYKGLGSRTATSNLYEWFDSISFYTKLYNELTNPKEKARIGLLIYSTFFESSDFYNTIGNLARVILGYRCSPYLYHKHLKADRWLGTSEKVSSITEILYDINFPLIANFFDINHFKQLRNTFFHSSYSIFNGEYILHNSDPIVINNLGEYSKSIEDFIMPKIKSVLEFYIIFKTEFEKYFNSYQTNINIRGRFPEETDIIILGSPNGLKGFIAGNSRIVLNSQDEWEGHNIRFDFPTEIDRYVQEEMDRFFKKTAIRSNDGKLQQLYEIVKDRNRPQEIKNLAQIYLKFADMFRVKGMKEEDFFKQGDLYKRSLLFYEKMIELDVELGLSQNFALVKYITAVTPNQKMESLQYILSCFKGSLNESLIKNTLHILKEIKKVGIDISKEKNQFCKILQEGATQELNDLISNSIKEIERI